VVKENFVLQIATEDTVIKWLLYSSVLPFFSTGLSKYLGLYYLLAFILPRYCLAENTVSMTLFPDRIYLFFVMICLHNWKIWPPRNS